MEHKRFPWIFYRIPKKKVWTRKRPSGFFFLSLSEIGKYLPVVHKELSFPRKKLLQIEENDSLKKFPPYRPKVIFFRPKRLLLCSVQLTCQVQLLERGQVRQVLQVSKPVPAEVHHAEGCQFRAERDVAFLQHIST